jgi:hypothetical protein
VVAEETAVDESDEDLPVLLLTPDPVDEEDDDDVWFTTQVLLTVNTYPGIHLHVPPKYPDPGTLTHC